MIHSAEGAGGAGPIRVGLVGCGFIAEHHAAAYRGDPRAELAAVCDVARERAEMCARAWGARAYPDLDSMLAAEELDLVAVVTPQHLHFGPAMRAIEAGKHVFVEKPLALELGEAEALVRAAAERAVRLATNFNRRFGQPYQLAKQCQAAGRLGEFAYLTLKIAVGLDQPPREPDHVAYDLLIHLADLARHFGGEVRRVSAQASRRGAARVCTNMAVALEFAAGGVGTLLVSLDGTRLHPIEFAEIGGTAGQAHVHNVVGGFDFCPHDSDLATRWRPQPFGGHHHLLQFYPTTIVAHVDALLTALLNAEPPPVTGEDGVRALRIVLAALHSAETGRACDPAKLGA